MTRDAARLRVRGEISELLRLAGPVIAARLGIMVMGLTDTLVVGRFSSAQLGFHALGWAPTGVVLNTAIGLLNGVQVMTSRAMGEGRPDRAGAVLRRGVVYAFWVGLASATALLLLGPPMLAAMGLDPVLAAGAAGVIQVLALSMPMYLVAGAVTSFLEGLGRPVPGMLVMWTANGLNLCLCLVLVPGGFGLPAMGAVGAAWATFGARLVLLMGLGVYVVLMPQARALGVLQAPARDLPREVEQRRVGFGAGASLLVESAAFAGMSIVAGWLGGLAVAGWAVILNVASLVFMVPLGLAAATSVRVARAYGARDRHAVVTAGMTGFGVCAAMAAAISLLIWIGAPVIARAYTTDPALVRLAVPALWLSCLFYIPDALQVVAGMALRARGDVWIPTFTHIASYTLVMLPLGWALAHPAGLGLNGIVWAVIASSLMAAGLLLGRFRILARQTL